jgi:hypothetical protein
MESDDVKFIYLVTRSVNIGKKMKECKRQRWGLGPFLYPKKKIKKKTRKSSQSTRRLQEHDEDPGGPEISSSRNSRQ